MEGIGTLGRGGDPRRVGTTAAAATHGAAATLAGAAGADRAVGQQANRPRADAILIDPSGVSHLALIGRS